MSIVITGGGTGGHLVIAKAIKEELNKRGIKPIFIGSTYGQDMAWFEDDVGWDECYFFDTSGVVDKRGLERFRSIYEISKRVLDVKEIFKKHDVKKVLSVGGYSAAAASFGAIIFQKEFFIHEQNAVMGRLNALLKPFAKKIFQDDSSYFPIREIFFENQHIREDIKTIIFLGGSQGASAINEFAKNIAKNIDQRGVKIIHQTGKRDLKEIEEFYQKEGIEADVFDFSKEIEDKISRADFAICRAGASTLWELTASALPALFIPYPYAAGDHQYHNAKFLADKGLALLCRESDLREDILDEIFKIDLKSMSKGLIEIAKRDGAKNVVNELKST